MNKRKSIKHLLKTELDRTDKYITLVNMGKTMGVYSPEGRKETVKEREMLLEGLKESKANMAQYFSDYNKLIDEAINEIK